MFGYTEADFGFVILCPERNMGGLRGTSRSISRCYPERSQICITANDATKEEIKEMKEFCPTFKGRSTITSLMNTGLQKVKSKWAMFVFSGSYVKPRLFHPYARFLEGDKEIMFPIVDNKVNFCDCSLNGLFMPKKVIKEVGKFDEANPLYICRLLWALDAIEKGYCFKALMGARII